ncbi:hypothetical protein E4U54_004536, partial [Claviceps lovelessii]
MSASAAMHIDLDKAKEFASEFRASCLNQANRCAVSGEGKSWCSPLTIGPGIQACHIIPQKNYYLYPIFTGHVDNSESIHDSPRLLRKAWESTWSAKNGILLMKHLHDFFNARLFSIHPHTLRIRVFVPYDALLKYNGKKAELPLYVDRKALRHHYEMSCIENMAARIPDLYPTLSRASSISSPEVSSTKTTRTSLRTPSLPRTPTKIGASNTGDPNKRLRPTPPTGSLPKDNVSQNDSIAQTGFADLEDER